MTITTPTVLSAAQRSVLEALDEVSGDEHSRWLPAKQLADKLGLSALVLANTTRSLMGRGMVHRSEIGEVVYYRIDESIVEWPKVHPADFVTDEDAEPDAAPAKDSPPQIHFTVNGVRSGSPPGKGQNKLSAVAYFRTKGCVAGRDRLTTDELIGLLKGLGVEDPTSAPWKATLPNGVTVETEVV